MFVNSKNGLYEGKLGLDVCTQHCPAGCGNSSLASKKASSSAQYSFGQHEET